MIPVATTTISVYAIAESEPGEGRTRTVRASGIRAVIGALSGVETVRPGGGEERVAARLDCDTTTSSGAALTILHTDQVVDDQTGETFEVGWIKRKNGLGLDHYEAQIVLVIGAVG